MDFIDRVMLLPFFTPEQYTGKLMRGEDVLQPDIGLVVLRVSAYDRLVVQNGFEEQAGLSTYLDFAEEDRILAKTRFGNILFLFIEIA